MKLGVPREVQLGERRVAATPDTVTRLGNLGFEVLIESGAGDGARFPDAAYAAAGATIVTAEQAWSADVVIKVNPPQELPDGTHEADRLGEGGTLVSLIWPAQNREIVDRLAARGANVLALDCVPRISRAQKMDVLSSMANIAGYRAIIEAATLYGGFFAGQITAAGKTPPARVLVIGAGVAGLAAIAAARALGAVVYAFDTRMATKEQVASLGANFLELEFDESGEGGGGYAKVMSKEFIDAEMALFREQAPLTDVVVTTALIPGKKAPTLWTEDMVHAMKPGSVVVDLAAGQGGNCPCSVPGEVADVGGVSIVGYTDLTSRLPTHASQFFGTNVAHLLDDMGGAEGWRIDLDDEAVRGALVLFSGELMWPPPPPSQKSPEVVRASHSRAPQRQSGPAASAPAPAPPAPAHKKKHAEAPTASPAATVATLVVSLALAVGVAFAPTEFIQHVTVFVLACFIGWQVVWNVAPALHTPLMSVTNAISGIIIVGGVIQATSGNLDVATLLGAVAILVASINVFGGFAVTQRMLQMFRK